MSMLFLPSDRFGSSNVFINDLKKNRCFYSGSFRILFNLTHPGAQEGTRTPKPKHTHLKRTCIPIPPPGHN